MVSEALRDGSVDVVNLALEIEQPVRQPLDQRGGAALARQRQGLLLSGGDRGVCGLGNPQATTLCFRRDGPFHRRPEDHAPDATRGAERYSGQRLLLLQVGAPETDTDRGPPQPARRRRPGRIRGVEAHLRDAAHPCRSRRGRLHGERKHGRRLDATTRPAGSETEAPEGNNQAGQDRAEVSGSAETRLHRAGGACEVVWRHDRDPDR